MRTTRYGLAALFALFGAISLTSAADTPVDPFATPIESARIFLDASAKMDLDGMLAHSLDGSDRVSLVKWIWSANVAAKELREAAVKKYGPTAESISPAVRGSEVLKDLKATGQGDDAVIVVPKGGGSAGMTIKLKKVEGKWKVDPGSVPHPPTEELRTAMLKGLKDSLADLQADKFLGFDDLKLAVQNRTLAATLAMAVAEQANQSATPAAPATGTPTLPDAPFVTPRVGGPVLNASDNDALIKAEGQVQTVVGEIDVIEWSKTGKVLNITFKGQGVSFKAASFVKNKEALDGAFGGDVVKALEGKTIRVTGELHKFQGAMEILVDEPGQIVIVAKP